MSYALRRCCYIWHTVPYPWHQHCHGIRPEWSPQEKYAAQSQSEEEYAGCHSKGHAFCSGQILSMMEVQRELKEKQESTRIVCCIRSQKACIDDAVPPWPEAGVQCSGEYHQIQAVLRVGLECISPMAPALIRTRLSCCCAAEVAGRDDCGDASLSATWSCYESCAGVCSSAASSARVMRRRPTRDLTPRRCSLNRRNKTNNRDCTIDTTQLITPERSSAVS